MHLRRLVVLAVAATTLGTAQAQERSFRDRTRVLEVQIPVQVVDRAGAPVRGLTAESFRIFDGKRQREILGFEAVDLETLTTGSTGTEIDRELSPFARRHLLLLFDLTFSGRAARTRARLAARELVLNQLHSTDLVAVATHSIDRGGRFLVTFTSDRAQVARAIDLLESVDLREVGSDPLRLTVEDPSSARQSLEQRDEELYSGGTATTIEGGSNATLWLLSEEMRKGERNQARGRVSSWAASLGDLGRMLTVIPGSKQILYFSEGFDGQLFLGRQTAASAPGSTEETLERERWWQRTSPDEDVYGNSPLRGDVDRMLDQLRSAGCVLHAVDIAPAAVSGAAQRNRRARRDALFYIARGTGGDLAPGAGDLGERLTKLLERTSVTYVLSFESKADDKPGTYRRIKLKADLPRAARIAYRQGYRIPPPFAELHPFEKNLLASEAVAGAVTVEDFEVMLLSAPFRADEGSAYVPVVIELDGSSLLAGHAADLLPLEIYAYATDLRGQMADHFSRRFALDLARAGRTFETGGVKYYGHLELPAGEYRLRVLVRNSSNGLAGLAERSLAVPAFDQGERVFLPPFFLETRPGWQLVREQRSKEEQSQDAVVYPFTVDGAPYVPAVRPNLEAGAGVQLCLVAYNLSDGEVEVEASILAADGSLMNDDLNLDVDRTTTGIQGLDKILATVRLPTLEPGDYSLKVGLVDKASGSMEIGVAEFRLDEGA